MNNKIEMELIVSDKNIIEKTMKPIYASNDELICGVIEYNGRTYYLDNRDRDSIINSTKSFVFANEYDIYPSYPINYKRISYLEFIYNVNSNENNYYSFKNGNIYDLRRCNVQVSHSYTEKIMNQYNTTNTIPEYIEGHYNTRGTHAGIMKNPLWKINEDGKEYLLMYCETDTICKLCQKSYETILEYEIVHNGGKKLTWFKGLNGYIMSSKNMYIHQVITGCYGNGKGTGVLSIDHIDRDPLNNSFENLRIATRKEQEANCKGNIDGTKRERKINAKPLPEGLTQDMMRKYVVYYHEWLDKDKTKDREYFKVEKHPKLNKIWIGTKSNKISIFTKLFQVNKFVDELDNKIVETNNIIIPENYIQPSSTQNKLPTYISFVNRSKPFFLSFDKKDEATKKRLNLKMNLPEEYDMDEQLTKFIEKIKAKYPQMSFDT